VDTRGIWVVDTSGPTTVAFGSGNFIHNSKFSVEIDGALTAIAGNSLADLSLDGSPDRYILLTNGALHGQEIDARHTQFEGGGAGLKSIDANFALEDKITHATDDSSVGFIRVYDGNVFVTQSSGSIQRGVSAAEAGDTLHISAGTFSEAVVIDKWMGVKGTTGPVNTVVTNPLGAAIITAMDSGQRTH
jgi:hypothetical protein